MRTRSSKTLRGLEPSWDQEDSHQQKPPVPAPAPAASGSSQQTEKKRKVAKMTASQTQESASNRPVKRALSGGTPVTPNGKPIQGSSVPTPTTTSVASSSSQPGEKKQKTEKMSSSLVREPLQEGTMSGTTFLGLSALAAIAIGCNHRETTTTSAPTTAMAPTVKHSTVSTVSPHGKPIQCLPAAAATATTATTGSKRRESRDGTAREPVEQFDLVTRKTIRRFDSLQAAAIAVHVYQQDIYDCVNGSRESAGGFGWRRPRSKKAKKVVAATDGKGMISKKTSSSQSTDKKGSGMKVAKQALSSSSGSRMQDVGSGGGHNQASLAVEGAVGGREVGGQEGNEEDYEQIEAGGDDGATGSISPAAWSNLLDGLTGEGGGDEVSECESSRVAPAYAQASVPIGASGIGIVELTSSSSSSSHTVSASPLVAPTATVAVAVHTTTIATTLSPAPITPASHALPTLTASSSSSSAPTTSSSTQTSPAPIAADPTSPPPTITEQQRRDMRDAIFNHLLTNEFANPLRNSMTTAEKSARISELCVRATTVEDIFYQYRSDAYLELFDRARLLEQLTCPSIKALCTL